MTFQHFDLRFRGTYLTLTHREKIRAWFSGFALWPGSQGICRLGLFFFFLKNLELGTLLLGHLVFLHRLDLDTPSSSIYTQSTTTRWNRIWISRSQELHEHPLSLRRLDFTALRSLSTFKPSHRTPHTTLLQRTSPTSSLFQHRTACPPC